MTRAEAWAIVATTAGVLREAVAIDVDDGHWSALRAAALDLGLPYIYRTNGTPYLAMDAPQRGDMRDDRAGAVKSSAEYLNENFEKAPVLMIPCLEGRPDGAPAGISASYWGSLLPAVWSFMLALRSRGLGSAWTTLHLIGEGEKQAAEVIGIPFDKYAQGGLFPIAYTKGTEFKLANRLPAEQLTHWNTW